MANVNTKGLTELAQRGLLHAIGAIAVDGISEAGRLPFLNDQAPIGGQGMNNAELGLSIYGGAKTIFGLLGTVTNRNVLGMGKTDLVEGLSVLGGVYLWENFIADAVGLRS